VKVGIRYKLNIEGFCKKPKTPVMRSICRLAELKHRYHSFAGIW